MLDGVAGAEASWWAWPPAAEAGAGVDARSGVLSGVTKSLRRIPPRPPRAPGLPDLDLGLPTICIWIFFRPGAEEVLVVWRPGGVLPPAVRPRWPGSPPRERGEARFRPKPKRDGVAAAALDGVVRAGVAGASFRPRLLCLRPGVLAARVGVWLWRLRPGVRGGVCVVPRFARPSWPRARTGVRAPYFARAGEMEPTELADEWRPGDDAADESVTQEELPKESACRAGGGRAGKG